jgi:hypothetical protein
MALGACYSGCTGVKPTHVYTKLLTTRIAMTDRRILYDGGFDFLLPSEWAKSITENLQLVM